MGLIEETPLCEKMEKWGNGKMGKSTRTQNYHTTKLSNYQTIMCDSETVWRCDSEKVHPSGNKWTQMKKQLDSEIVWRCDSGNAET